MYDIFLLKPHVKYDLLLLLIIDNDFEGVALLNAFPVFNLTYFTLFYPADVKFIAIIIVIILPQVLGSWPLEPSNRSTTYAKQPREQMSVFNYV